MLLELAFGKLKAFLVFLVLAWGFRLGIVAAGLTAVLLATARIELTVSVGSAIAVGAVAVLTKGAADHSLATLGGHFITDWVRSRIWNLAYRLFGGVFTFADEAHPLAPVQPSAVQGQLRVVRTSRSLGERFAVLAPLALTKGAPPMGGPIVSVDPSVTYQTFLGFGGSFTESSADLWRALSSSQQQTVLEAYFSEATGLGFKLGRLHIGSCDFSKGNWSCVEQDDEQLASFNIERYRRSMLPMMHRAQEIAKSPLQLMASPWSPPGWMKDSGTMMPAAKLLPQFREAWARHYVKFARAFAAEGLPLWSLTVQNEPGGGHAPWEGCSYEHEEERDFVRDFLGPALRESGLDVKLLVWDHNRDDMFIRAKTVYSDPEAEKFVWGVAYHWYGDPRYEFWPPREGQVLYDNLRRVHELRPDKHIIMSESCQEFGPRLGDWSVAERYGEAIIRDLNNWLEGWIDWNLLLDSNGGPNHQNNLVSAPVIIDVARSKLLFHTHYYYIGHFSRFIKPGAKRVLSSTSRDGLEATAFVNPDGSLATVVLNQGDYDIDFMLEIGGQVASAQAPAHSISTFLRPAPSA